MAGNYGRNPAVILDTGSGFTKMGFAGNIEPQFIVPTCVANSTKAKQVSASSAKGFEGIPETDFYVGAEGYAKKDSESYLLSWPVVKGRVDNWDDMERFLSHCIFRNLRCTPEEHLFLLTEPPFNAPENREHMAEIMFETFNVQGLNISVQAVLSLYAQYMNDVETSPQTRSSPDLTGIVVDSGDGLTHVIPVAGGYVIGSCIREIPMAGRHVTEFISDLLRDRGEPVPPEQRLEAARQIKEQHSYLCKDVVEEYKKFDKEPGKRFKTLTGNHFRTREEWNIEIGYERFLAPELFFNPELFTETVTTPLPTLVDSCIQMCPIDYRRRLYSNVVLSGGSTTFTHFKERLQHDLQGITDARAQRIAKHSGGNAEAIQVKVNGGKRKGHQRCAAWLGGSLLATEDKFPSMCKLKAEYDEVGPSCMRGSPVLLG